MDIKLICNECNWEGFKLETIQVNEEEQTVFLLGKCPFCGRFVRISLNQLIKETLEEGSEYLENSC